MNQATNEPFPLIAVTLAQEAPACRGEDPELFFSEGKERADVRALREERAKALCGGCAVLAECTGYVLTHNEHGIWGGMSEDDRSAVKNSKRRR